MTTITVDFEHNCEKWWAAAHRTSPPPECSSLTVGADFEVTVPNMEAARFLAWATRLPGWDEHPFIVRPATKREASMARMAIKDAARRTRHED